VAEIKITENYPITILASIRNKFNIKIGDRPVFIDIMIK